MHSINLIDGLSVAGELVTELSLRRRTVRDEIRFRALQAERPEDVPEDVWSGACALATQVEAAGQAVAPAAVLEMATEDYLALNRLRQEVEDEARRFHGGQPEPAVGGGAPGEGDRLEPGGDPEPGPS